MAASNRVVEVLLRGKDGLSGAISSARQSLGGFAKFAAGIAAGIGATFGAISLGRFFASSVDEAANAERAYAQVGAAIRNVGGDAKAAQPEVDALVTSLSRMSGVDDETVSDALTRLITLTGDYKKAMDLLPTALDVAAGRQIELGAAADLVAKASNGNTSALTRMGIAVKDGADAVQILRDRFGGFAATEGQTLQGTLGRISVAWGDVKEAVGRAITGGEGFRGTGNRIVDMLVQMEKWIRDNEGAISAFTTSALHGIGAVASAVGNLVVAWGNLLHPESATAQPLLDRLNSLEREQDVATMLNTLGREKLRLTDEIAQAQKRYDDALAAESTSRSDTPSEEFRNSLSALTDLQNELAGVSVAFDAGSAKLQSMAKSALDAGKALATVPPPTAVTSLDDHAQALVALAKAGQATTTDLLALGRVEADLLQTFRDGTKSAEDRANALRALNQVQDALGRKDRVVEAPDRTVEKPVNIAVTPHVDPKAVADTREQLVDLAAPVEVPVTLAATQGGPVPPTETGGVPVAAPPPPPDDFRPTNEDLIASKLPPIEVDLTPKLDKDAVAEVTAKIGDAVAANDQTLAAGYQIATDAVTAFGTTFSSVAGQVLSGNLTLWGAIAKGGRAAVGSIAAAKAQESFIDAGKALGDAIWKHDPSALAAIPKLVASGTAYAALALTLGGKGGGGGVASAGGGGGGGLTPNRFQSDNAAGPQNTLTIVIKGGSSSDSGLQDWLIDTLNGATGRGVTVRTEEA